MPQARSKINNIVIVGGGAAGWLCANHLAKTLGQQTHITLIESPNIPTIGVGEGTVPSIRESLNYFGISETDLIRTCHASFKQSIEFVGWQPPNSDGSDHRYHHIFDYPSIKQERSLLDWLRKGNKTASFADTFSIQSHLIDRGLSPKKFTQPEYEGVCNYAYHFDAGKFGELLAQNAVKKLGVTHKKAEIRGVVANKTGDIDYLLTDTDERISADLFVDCTGTRSLLLGEFFNVPFISRKDMLFTDTALAIQIGNSQQDDSVACSTKAVAHAAGWIWDIALSNRRGVGIVYSSRHMSQAEAQKQLAKYVGESTFAEQTTNVRKISMKTGRYERFWQNKCVAVGMSQGFVEPLEATGLLMFDKSAQLLANHLAKLAVSNSGASEQANTTFDEISNSFNQELACVWDGVFDFIKLHYCISARTDSQFWLEHQDPNTWSDTLKNKLELWSQKLPSHQDFGQLPGVFNLQNYLYVLFGMSYKTKLDEEQDLTDSIDTSSIEHCAMMQDISVNVGNGLLSHRALLTQIQTHGLKRI